MIIEQAIFSLLSLSISATQWCILPISCLATILRPIFHLANNLPELWNRYLPKVVSSRPVYYVFSIFDHFGGATNQDVLLKAHLFSNDQKHIRGARKMNLFTILVELWCYDSRNLCSKKRFIFRAPLCSMLKRNDFIWDEQLTFY